MDGKALSLILPEIRERSDLRKYRRLIELTEGPTPLQRQISEDWRLSLRPVTSGGFS
jgi:hypothetical protein